MRVYRHPVFEHITTNCTHPEDECDHPAKGWIPLLDDAQMKRFEEIELETELAPTARPKSPRSQARRDQ